MNLVSPLSAALAALVAAAELKLNLERSLALLFLALTVSDRIIPPLATVHGLEVRVADVALAALLVRVALARGPGEAQALLYPKDGLPLAVFMWVAAFATLSSFLHSEAASATSMATATLRLLWSALVFPLAYTVARSRGVSETISAMFLVADAQVLSMFAEFMGFAVGLRWEGQFMYPVGPLMTVRTGGLVRDPGGVLYVIAPFLLLTWSHVLLVRNPLVKVPYGIRFFLYSAAVLTTLSRGGLVGLMAAAGGIALLSGSLVQATVVLGVLALVALPLAGPPLGRLAATIRSLLEGATPPSTSEGQRLVTWGLAWRAFSESPITGLGFSGFRLWAARMHNLTAIFETTSRAATSVFTATTYNQYLQLVVDLGPLGLVSYAASQLALFSAVGRKLRTELAPAIRAALLAFVGYLIYLAAASVTDTWMNAGAPATSTFLLVSGIGLALASTRPGVVQAAGHMGAAPSMEATSS